MRRRGANCSAVVMKRGKCPGSEGSGSPTLGRVNRQREEPDMQRKAAAFARWHEPDDARVSSPDVCPAKAGMFSRGQTCRGRSQSPVVWIAEVMETESSKPIDEVFLGK